MSICWPLGIRRVFGNDPPAPLIGMEEAMAEILALGISHYPPLTGRDDRMAGILRRMLRNPKLPEHLRTPEGWPAPMRAEWGDDQGTSSAARHRADLVGWMETRPRCARRRSIRISC